uniref:Uncharacterized protein n=1 Tax=Cacopsylla melanoneura TaxID=428564 RepID=A0A8D8RLZ8_9HEMI
MQRGILTFDSTIKTKDRSPYFPLISSSGGENNSKERNMAAGYEVSVIGGRMLQGAAGLMLDPCSRRGRCQLSIVSHLRLKDQQSNTRNKLGFWRLRSLWSLHLLIVVPLFL